MSRDKVLEQNLVHSLQTGNLYPNPAYTCVLFDQHSILIFLNSFQLFKVNNFASTPDIQLLLKH